jgi:hypothetical protein
MKTAEEAVAAVEATVVAAAATAVAAQVATAVAVVSLSKKSTYTVEARGGWKDDTGNDRQGCKTK